MKRKNAEPANVFEQLGFSSSESRVLTIKADLLGEIRKAIQAHGYTQKQVAELWDQSQPRVSEIMRGRLEAVTIDKLITYVERLGLGVTVQVRKSA